MPPGTDLALTGPRAAPPSLSSTQVLHLVDFEQLKIENQQYLERIDAKNKDLLALKLSTGKTVQVRGACHVLLCVGG